MAPTTHPLWDHFRRQTNSPLRDAAMEAGVCGSCLTGGRKKVAWKAARWSEDGLELDCGSGVVFKAPEAFVAAHSTFMQLLNDAEPGNTERQPCTTPQCCSTCSTCSTCSETTRNALFWCFVSFQPIVAHSIGPSDMPAIHLYSLNMLLKP